MDNIISTVDQAGLGPRPVTTPGHPDAAPGQDAGERAQAALKRAREPGAKAGSKTAAVLKLLRRGKGASIAELTAATGWQAHSVRAHLSATVRKKLGLSLTSEVGKDGVGRHRIVADVEAR